MSEKMAQIKVVKREDREREINTTRSIEISMMRELMRRYPEQARDVAVEVLKITLTKRPA